MWYWGELSKQKFDGKWLGVAENVGPIMTFWIFPISRIPIPRSTVIQIFPSELQDVNAKDLLNNFTSTITVKLGNIINHLVLTDSPAPPPRKIQ